MELRDLATHRLSHSRGHAGLALLPYRRPRDVAHDEQAACHGALASPHVVLTPACDSATRPLSALSPSSSLRAKRLVRRSLKSEGGSNPAFFTATMDCFVALLLAMTAKDRTSRC